MRLDWNLQDDYEDFGGEKRLREAIQEALSGVPREHLRRLDILSIRDDDPKGKSLGIWRQDHHGCAIELYLRPHVAPLRLLAAPVREFALSLHLAYTLFHEVGHHVTRVLNPRAAPPRKAPRVHEKIERWADEYAEKRLQKLCGRWLSPEGHADSPDGKLSLITALRALRLDTVILLTAVDDGTKTAGPPS